MKVIEFTPLELINMIDNSNNLELSGGYGSLFLWNGNLIKLDNQLYSVIDSISKNEIESRIKGINLYASKYKDNPYISTEQIAYLLEKQPNIRLTDFDLGVVKVNGTVCGTILPNHLDYDNLKNLKTDNPTLVYKILKNVFLALSELEENQIYHLDLYKEKY